MKRRIWKRIVIVLTLTVFLGTSFPAVAADADKLEKIRITYVKFPLNAPAIVAYKLGMIEKELAGSGISVERPEITSGGKQTQAIAAGSVDIASVLSSTSALVAKANGVDLKIIGVFARAPKAFNVMAIDPSIKSVADLKGKTVAGPKGSLLNQTLFAALIKSGLKFSDVRYVHMSVAKGLAALIGKSVDAALIAGPAVPKAESQGARVIANGEGLVEGLIVTAVRGEFLDSHPDIVKRYMSVQKKAIDYMNRNPEEAYKLVAEETSISVDEVKKMFSWYDYDPKIRKSDIDDLAATQDFLVKSGMLKETAVIDSIIYDLSK